MNVNRKSMTFGLVGLGIVGVLVTGGVVAAQAATDDGAFAQPTSTTSPDGSRNGFGFGHMAGMSFGENSSMTAVARYLGLSEGELQDQLQLGTSLANVAEAQGKSVTGLEDAMIAALRINLDTNSTLTADQKDAAVEQMRSSIDSMVNATHTAGQGMGMGMGNGSGSNAGWGMHAGTGTTSAWNSGMAWGW